MTETKIVLAVGYFVTIVLCVIAIVIPYWTDIETGQPEVCRPVVLTKTSGLLWSNEYLQIKQEILPKEDANWKRTTGHGITAVLALMCFGLIFLILRLIIITGYLCYVCCWCDDFCCCCCCCNDKEASAYSCWIGILSSVLIGVGVLVFYLDVKTDDEKLISGFWFAVVSAFLAFITGLVDMVVSIRQYREKQNNRGEEKTPNMNCVIPR